ncbi:MAG: AEC family transporter [Coriobacteriia bacterium]|nr:AEC family transporter [Coriobacteriia bacterium]
MSLVALIEAIARILALVVVGIALRRSGILKREDAKPLNGVIIYAALPALIFNVVVKARLSLDLVRVMGVAWAVTLIGLAIAWGLSRALRLPPRIAGGFIIAAAIGNTGYVGYPVVRALLGEASLAPAVFYDVFGSVSVMLIFGIAIAAHYGRHEGRIDVLREFITFPAVIAMLAALAFRFVPWPAAVMDTVMDWTGFAGTIAAPLIMVSLGVSLDFAAFRDATAPLAALSVVKLLVLPALAVGFATLLGVPEATRVAAIEAGMPTALLALIMAQRFDLDAEFVAAASLTTTVACVATVPLVQLLLR